jgi:hypothetical protein
VVDAPLHMVPSLAVPELSATVMTAVGKGLTVIVAVSVSVQPFAVVIVTVYVVVTIGDTILPAVLAPLLQKYNIPPPDAVRVTDDPLQIIPSLLVVPEFSDTNMVAVGIVHVPGTVVTVCDGRLVVVPSN